MELKKVRINGWVFEKEGVFVGNLFIQKAEGNYLIAGEEVDSSFLKLEEVVDNESPYRVFYEDDSLKIKMKEGDSLKEVFCLKTNFEDFDFPEHVGVAMFYLESLNVKWRRKYHPEPNV